MHQDTQKHPLFSLLENDVASLGGERFLVPGYEMPVQQLVDFSIAISLKRIADQGEPINVMAEAPGVEQAPPVPGEWIRRGDASINGLSPFDRVKWRVSGEALVDRFTALGNIMDWDMSFPGAYALKPNVVLLALVPAEPKSDYKHVRREGHIWHGPKNEALGFVGLGDLIVVRYVGGDIDVKHLGDALDWSKPGRVLKSTFDAWHPK